MVFAGVVLVMLLPSLRQQPIPASGLLDVRLACEDELVIHYRDGYVIHHTIGQSRSNEKVIQTHPLDIALASKPDSFGISSSDDPEFSSAIHPSKIFRKSKGVDFAWFTDTWVNGRAVNTRPDFVAEHWLYLHLPKTLKWAKTYRLSAPELGIEATVKTSSEGLRSDWVHTNLLGYRPDAPAKFGYVYGWEGDGGSLDVHPFVGRSFKILNAGTGQIALTGKVAFRRDKLNKETAVVDDTPNANFLSADVAECDLSALNQPGKYLLEVEGVGRSPAFTVAPDIYRDAFHQVMKGILGNRSGIALEPPYVPYSRPAPHNPLITPGFAGKLKYTKSRYLDRKDADYSADDKPAIESGILGDLSVAGWYQDAGDWDSYASHLQVPQQLLMCYQLAPSNFADGELNLPGAPSKLPDILKEAEWLPAFCYRLRHELLDRHYGTGGIGLRICGDHFGGDTGPKDVGLGSWQDVDRTWTASGEDPVSTFGYAGVAANLALCLTANHPAEAVDWKQEAIESYAWAEKNTKPGDQTKPEFREYRTYALSALALLTGDPAYEASLLEATSGFSSNSRLWWSDLSGAAVYLLTPSAKKNPTLVERFQSALLGTADAELQSADTRALRWGGDWGMPMLIGQQTTPWVQAMAVASVVTRTSNPVKSKAYFGAVESTADYFLGTNPLNQTWVTGLGPKSPINVFHMDSWYEKGQYPRPGIVPYGPWRKALDEGVGPWDHDWANKSVYPKIDLWPGAERWFENRCSPLTGEFTISQNLAPSAFTYGFLCGAKK